MAFRIRWTPEARKQYDRLMRVAEKSLANRHKSGKKKSSKQEGLFKQVHKAIGLLAGDPRHPGLQTHSYSSLSHPYDDKGKLFVAYAQQKTPAAYRIFWCYGPDKGDITIIAITRHP